VAHTAGAVVVAVVAAAVVHAGEESQEAVHEASEMGHRCNAAVNPTAGNAVTLYQRTCRPSSRLME